MFKIKNKQTHTPRLSESGEAAGTTFASVICAQLMAAWIQSTLQRTCFGFAGLDDDHFQCEPSESGQ
jgi:hypothetical protein